jgi:HPt (histidine-containing phosphotransfer) domain-containing protein
MDEHVAKPVRARDLEAVLVRFLPDAGRRAAPAAPDDLLDEIRAAMGGGFENVVREYLADAETSLGAMRAAAARGDDRSVEAAAHRLKGSSGIVNAKRIAEICEALVDEPHDAADRLDRLGEELERTRTHLQSAVRQPG